MALLDVTEVLTDPDFTDPLVCERNAQIVGSNGMASLTTAVTNFYGVVCAAGGAELDRLPEGERNTATISVTTKFVLTSGDDGNTADIVRFRGKRYTVKQVNDYSHFGAGFSNALCVLIPLSG